VACGLRDSRTVMRGYNVPGEVQHCMGGGNGLDEFSA
jgi:hypothetical protein